MIAFTPVPPTIDVHLPSSRRDLSQHFGVQTALVSLDPQAADELVTVLLIHGPNLSPTHAAYTLYFDERTTINLAEALYKAHGRMRGQLLTPPGVAKQ